MSMKRTPNVTNRLFGFSLVELLTVIAVIALLAAIIIPIVRTVRHQADSSKSISNLRQIGNTVSLYTNENKGAFPLLNRNVNNINSESKFFWTHALESYVLDWERGSNDGQKHPMFTDPAASDSHGISDYGANMNVFLDANPNNPNRSTSALTIYSLTEPAKTLVVCTAYARQTERASWYVQANFANGGEPNNVPEARLGSGNVGVVYADGHVGLVAGERIYEDLEYRRELFAAQ